MLWGTNTKMFTRRKKSYGLAGVDFLPLLSEMPLQNTTNYRQHLALKDLKKNSQNS